MLIKNTKDTSVLVTATVLNTKIRETENKILTTGTLVITTFINTKISEVKNKVPDDAKYITTQQFSRLNAEKFAAKLKQANLVSKTNFNSKIINLNRKLPEIK